MYVCMYVHVSCTYIHKLNMNVNVEGDNKGQKSNKKKVTTFF